MNFPEKLTKLLHSPAFLLVIIGILIGIVGLRLYLIGNKSPEVVFIEDTNAASSSAMIKVHIAGAVEKEGVYELAYGSRIQDLLDKAGGLSSAADKEWANKQLNLAAKLTDGAKIYIPETDEAPQANTQTNTAGSTTLTNINSATKSQLEALPGIGPVTADKIISARPYQTVEELVSKKVISQGVFSKIKDLVSL